MSTRGYCKSGNLSKSGAVTHRRTIAKLWLCSAGIVGGLAISAHANPTIYTDAHGDQSAGSTTKTRDIWSASVDDDGTNLYFTFNLDPGGTLDTSNFNFGIGITNGNPTAGGDTQNNLVTNGNPYIRDIAIDSSLGGMMDWVGLFPNGGAGTAASPFTGYGFNDYVFGTPGSTKPAGVWTQITNVGNGVPFNKQTSAFSAPGGTHPSSITVAVPIADFASNLPLTPGGTFKFDMYSTGTGGGANKAGQTAYDSLADQSVAAPTATTEYNGTVLDTYTLNATAAPLQLVWNNTTGAGDGTTWDMAQSGSNTLNQNWLDSTTPFDFFQNNAVTFNDSNNGHYGVSLNSTVRPSSVTVNNSGGDYTISGTGTIAGTGGLTKSGSNALTISTANNYTGMTTVTGGTLVAANNSALGSSTAATAGLSIGAATVDFTSAAPTVASLASTSGSASIVLGNSAASTGTVLTVGANNASTTFGGSITDLSATNGLATGGLTKVGSGTLTLTGTNNYTGATTINAGVLRIDANQGGSLSNSPLVLGGGTFSFLGQTGAVTARSIGGLTLNSGSGSGFNVDGGNSTSTTLNLVGPITASAAGTSLDISTATSGSTVGVVTTTQANVNGILSGRITFNGKDFAANGPTPGTSPIGAPTYSVLATVAGTNTNNSLVTNSATLGSGTTTTNSLKITDSSTAQSLEIGAGNRLVLSSGGLLFTGTSDYSISDGTLASATSNPSDLIVHQYGTGALTIGSVIADGNGPSTLTKAGPGILILSGANTYTGNTLVNAGTLVLKGTNVSPNYFVNAATLSLQGAGSVSAGTITLSGASTLTTSVANALSGTTALVLNSGSPSAVFSQANSYSGPTTINAGTLQLANTNAAQNSTVTLNVANGLTFGAGVGTAAIGGLIGAANLALTDTAAGPVTLQLGNTSALAYTGVLSGNGGLDQTGSGTTTISAANTNTGLTTVTGGTLVVTNNAGLGSTTSVTAGLLMNPASGTATIDFTSANPNIASLASSGAGTASVVLGNTGATPASTTLSVGFNNASTTFSGVISDLSATAPAATGALTKVGLGALVLNGANTYSGITTGTAPNTTTIGTNLNGGTIVAGNIQALGNPATALFSASPSSTTTQLVTLDIATDTSILPYNVTESNAGTFVIQSDKATAGTPGITQTLGTLSFGAATLTAAAGPNVSGGAPAVAFGNVTLNSVHNNTTILNPTTADLILNGTVTSNAGTSPSAQIVVLQLDGTSAGNTVLGAISDPTTAGGTTAVTKSNTSTWTLAGVNTYTGNTNVNGGTLTLTASGAIASPNVIVAAGATANFNGSLTGTPPFAPQPPTLTANGTVNFGATGSGGSPLVRTLASLSFNTLAAANNGVVNVLPTANDATSHSNRTVLVTGALNFNAVPANGGIGLLNLNNNDLVVHNANTGDVNTAGSIANALKMGFNAGSGYWNGTSGIISTSAASDTRHLTTLGYRVSDGSTFDTVSPSAGSDVVVKYTYYGDADLNGTVNGADYQQIDMGFGTGATGWFNGDFNYDGVINGSDFALIDNTFNQLTATGASSLAILADPSSVIASSAAIAAVPEPSVIGLLAISACGLLSSRRRRRAIDAKEIL